MSPLKLTALGLAAIVGLGAATVLGNIVATATHVATAPGRVIQRTLETGNIISSYERFRDLNAAFVARVAQARQEQAFLAAETDPAERRRLRIDAGAVQQSCRDIAARYNADASKMNKAVFRHDAPEALDATLCE